MTLRSVEIEQEELPAAFSFDFYKGLHKRLFQDLYEWAGELRKINMSKSGTNFCPAEKIQSLGEAKFRRLQDMNEFSDLPKDEQINEIAGFYNELNMLHPFREGNGRTERLFFTLLMKRLGYLINFADYDSDELMVATIYAAQGVDTYLKDFFAKIIK